MPTTATPAATTSAEQHVTGTLYQDALAVLADFTPPNGEQDALREAFRALLGARSDALWRPCVPGHLTASALVVDPSREAVLLNLHRRVGRWLQFGGHLEEADETIAGAALREATEESGIAELYLHPQPIDLDVHALTCSLGQPTRHFDLRYVAVAPPGAQPAVSEESDDVAWFPWDTLPDPLGTGTERLVARALAALRASG